MASTKSYAYDFEADGICYNIISITDLTCEIAPRYSKSSNYTGDFNVPSEVQYNGKILKVIQIGKYAFKESSVTSVTISSGITSIDDYAFQDCKQMENISIPNTVKSIGWTTFFGCRSITTLFLPNSVSEIKGQTFAYCTSLREITIPDNIKIINKYTFRGCSSLNKVFLPNNLTIIGESAFEGCSSIEQIDIPKSIIEIGEAAFKECSSLSSFTIPASCEIIKNYAFNGCELMSKVIIEDGDINENPLSLGFSYIRNNNAKYYRDLFSEIPIDSLYLGKNVKRGKELLPENGEGFRAQSNNGLFGRDLKSLTIGDMVTDDIYDGNVWEIFDTYPVGYYQEYRPIKHITFGKRITKIPLISHHDLDSVVVLNENPPIAEGFTNKTYIDCKLYVPNGCKTAYETAEVWKNFWNVFELEQDINTLGVNMQDNYNQQKEVSRFTIDGIKLNNPHKGINIIKMNDGTVKKVMVK